MNLLRYVAINKFDYLCELGRLYDAKESRRYWSYSARGCYESSYDHMDGSRTPSWPVEPTRYVEVPYYVATTFLPRFMGSFLSLVVLPQFLPERWVQTLASRHLVLEGDGERKVAYFTLHQLQTILCNLISGGGRNIKVYTLVLPRKRALSFVGKDLTYSCDIWELGRNKFMI